MVSPGSLPPVNKINLVYLVHKSKKKVVDDEKNLHRGGKCVKRRVFFLNGQLPGNGRLWIETYSKMRKKLYFLFLD